MKKIVLFGAGKIGRSFIGQLFSGAGYEVVFVDVAGALIEALNERGEYTVVIKSNAGDRSIRVKNVRGVLAGNKQQVRTELAEAAICNVSVGKKGLPEVIPLLAEGLQERYRKHPQDPLDVILAENMRDAAGYVREKLKHKLPSDFPLESYVGLIETSIGKMVPIMPAEEVQKDMLKVYAEPYNTLILDRQGFRNPIPNINDLAPKTNIKAWVDRKLFIHNLGHAVTAYLGYVKHPQLTYTYEVLADPELKLEVRNTMLQSAAILMQTYPGEFTLAGLTAHIDDLLHRFANRALGDTIYRVGCDLPRKLGPNDRLAGAIKNGLQLHMPVNRIVKALVYGFHFRATDENGELHPNDKQVAAAFPKGLPYLLKHFSGFDSQLYPQVVKMAQEVE